MQGLENYPIITTKKHLVTDSRTINFPSESIFFAIKGVRNDGHKYIKELYNKGVCEFVLEKGAINEGLKKTIENFENTKIWVVENSILALQEMVAIHRSHYNVPVCAVTGSNGKTIVKEWLAQILASKFSIVKSPKSYNSQIGVPLSVWQINASHNFGIFEAGISQVNEMQNLEKVIQPTIGIFTNIGSAHNEYFRSNTEKIREKLRLFANVKALIYCSDFVELEAEIGTFFKQKNTKAQLISWSFQSKKGIFFKYVEREGKVFLEYNYLNEKQEIKINYHDKASIENICNCIVFLRYLEIDWVFIQQRIGQLKAISMRLELLPGIKNSSLINDSYNNDLVGLKLALDFMMQQKLHQNKIVVLSDLLQSGIDDETLYKEIAKLLLNNNINQVVGIGRVIKNYQHFFSKNSLFFETTDLFLEKILEVNFSNSLILVKGARAFSFEKIVGKLEQKSHETVLEINLDAVTSNLNYYKELVGKNTRIMAMVKALAYGAGNIEIANLLAFNNIDYLGVAYCDEGVQLRQSGISLPIMVMNPAVTDFEKLIENSLEPEIYSIDKLIAFSEFMEGQPAIAKIHIKLDTGMHRLGFENNDIEKLVGILCTNPNIIVASIFSHLVASEDNTFDYFTHAQYELFNNIAFQISKAIGYTPIKHILNTSGIARFPHFKMDMVRLGIGMYGVGVTPKDQPYLKMVGTLKTHISQIKLINENETVGYGRAGKITKPTKIATIAIGYADGFGRRFGNGIAKVLINNTLCPTIGNICMDMTMVDVTEAGEVLEGDLVIVFGENPSIYELAKQAQTIPYEILTGIGERVKRVFYKEGN